jgi:hypothetical protein
MRNYDYKKIPTLYQKGLFHAEAKEHSKDVKDESS